MKVNKMKSIPQRIAENLEARGIKDPNLSLINQGKGLTLRLLLILFWEETERSCATWRLETKM